jgi:hypothetical protein
MTVLRNCQELLPENNSLSIVVNDGHNHRRQFYEYIRNNYSLLTAKPSDILNTFILSHDLSLPCMITFIKDLNIMMPRKGFVLVLTSQDQIELMSIVSFPISSGIWNLKQLI